MSAKKAKQLRKLTKSIVDMQVASGNKVSAETLYIEKQLNRKFATLPPAQLGGPDGERVQIAAGTIMTTTSSVRGIYKAIKKKLNRGEQTPYASRAVGNKQGAPSQKAPLIQEPTPVTEEVVEITGA
jgi:hypothetical protein